MELKAFGVMVGAAAVLALPAFTSPLVGVTRLGSFGAAHAEGENSGESEESIGDSSGKRATGELALPKPPFDLSEIKDKIKNEIKNKNKNKNKKGRHGRSGKDGRDGKAGRNGEDGWDGRGSSADGASVTNGKGGVAKGGDGGVAKGGDGGDGGDGGEGRGGKGGVVRN